MNKITRPVWVEVNIENIKYNLRQIKETLRQGTEIMAVVKADAYGHGLIPVSQALIEEGIDRLAVALPEEGVELREAGFNLPIHVLGEVLSTQYKLIMDFDLIPTIARKDSLDNINRLAKELGLRKKIHLKVDTGMGRIGVQVDQALDFIKYAYNQRNIELEGLMTHFATADEEDKEYSYWQWKRFKKIINQVEEIGIQIPIKHASNSAAIIELSDFQLNMVRPGIALYGLTPSNNIKSKLKPALSWKAKIDFIKQVAEGTAISYGATYRTSKESKIATVPLGYADGYSRLLSNKGYVIINGQNAVIRGRVCMDQFMIDITEIENVDIGDELVLIGSQGNKTITATDLANMTDTINYEILCNISKRVPRVYL
ncbi:alanine racemase [Natronospora cellulosivora (SeqCode)]